MDIEASPPHSNGDDDAAPPGPPSGAADQPSSTPPAATAKLGLSEQTAAGACDQQPAEGSAEAGIDAGGPSQQDMVDNAAMAFTPGTVLQFDLDPEDASKSTTLNYRAVRPAFGGMEGGVRHCECESVSYTSMQQNLLCGLKKLQVQCS